MFYFSVVLGILSLGVSVLVGLFLWTGSAMPLIWREIAINTRKEPGQEIRNDRGEIVGDGGQAGPKYRAISVLSGLMQIMAVLVWCAGVGALIFSVSQ